MKNKWHIPGTSRRTAIRSLVGGSILLPALVSDLLAADDKSALNPLAPKQGHFPGKAKRVIFLFLTGGVSHVDSFDYKPALFDGQNKKVQQGYLHRPHWEFKPRGKSGLYISELFPRIAECADDLCVINSMKADHGDHFEATLQIHTGSFTFTRPSMGSWVSYGLGTFNQNLPSFVVLAPNLPYAGAQTWGSDFLPACHQGVRVVPGAEPIPNMTRKEQFAELQEMELGLIAAFNKNHLSTRALDPNLAGRVKSFETAYGMQQEAPEAFDISKESDATLKLYGLERGSTKGFAWQCLVARRLAQRGVRFIELIDTGASNNWDSHGDMQAHVPLAKNVDQPIAALLKDLKANGMFEDTLVVWGTEFGRTPYNAQPDARGREHHARAYSCWLAGAGVKPGINYGKSDEFGISIAENQVHVHDLHATILHLLGFEHEKFTYRHGGRDYRLTDVAGNVLKPILA